ncbi:MAG: hypothetical protein J07HB67_00281 [halophilic archaeon J07HB67]|nr:MAG: hypothetical protein J07HB67_00281 [halophilic archaeon J07HB67]
MSSSSSVAPANPAYADGVLPDGRRVHPTVRWWSPADDGSSVVPSVVVFLCRCRGWCLRGCWRRCRCVCGCRGLRGCWRWCRCVCRRLRRCRCVCVCVGRCLRRCRSVCVCVGRCLRRRRGVGGRLRRSRRGRLVGLSGTTVPSDTACARTDGGGCESRQKLAAVHRQFLFPAGNETTADGSVRRRDGTRQQR